MTYSDARPSGPPDDESPGSSPEGPGAAGCYDDDDCTPDKLCVDGVCI